MTSTADTISRLWIAARAMLARLGAAVAKTAAIAGVPAPDAMDVRVIRPWLRGLEAMVRRIVLIEAIALVRRGEAGARVAGAAGALSAGNRCDDARRPAVTLIALPPPVLIVAQPTTSAPTPTPAQRTRRAPPVRLWSARPDSGPRVRDIGRPLLVRDALEDRARLAACRHMRSLRAMRRPEPVRIFERIAALARIVERPLAAARRLARKVCALPMLALKLAAKKLPRSKHCVESEYAESRTSRPMTPTTSS